MRTEISVAPTSEPVSLSDVKAEMRVDSNEEDTHLNGLIASARAFFEEYTGFALIYRTLTAYLRFFPKASNLSLPYPPLVSVSSAKYFTAAGEQTLVADTDFHVDHYAREGSLVTVPGQSWPTDYLVPPGVAIEYVCGFGADESAVPDDIKRCLYSLIAYWDDVPEAVYVPGDNKISGKIDLLDLNAKSVLDYYRDKLRK